VDHPHLETGVSLVSLVGVHLPRVRAERAAVVRARVERVEVDLVQVETGVSFVHYLYILYSIKFPYSQYHIC